MKEFKISFVFKADDDWKAKDVAEVVTAAVGQIYPLGGAFVDKFTVEEMREKVGKE